MGLILGFSLKDFDNLLLRNNFNIYENIIRFFNFPSILLIVFNILVLSQIMSFFWRENRVFYLLIGVNPFILTNSFDAYNRFILTVFFMYIGYILIITNRLFALASTALVASLHPFNLLTMLYDKKTNRKLLLLSPIVLLLLTYFFSYYSDLIFEHEKYKLIISHGLDLASLYEGNLALKPEYTGADLFSVLARYVAMIFPYSFLIKENIALLLLSFYQLILFSYVIYKLEFSRLVIFSGSFLMVATLIGNFAVFNRHILPILIFLVIVNITEYKRLNNRSPKVL